jgi:uncharacterized lipoprotein YmbA
MKFAPLLALMLAASPLACAGSPNPVFYALSSRPGRPLASQPLTIELRRPGLPSYLDRPHIVRRVTSERLALDADERWGAPLQELVAGTLVDELSERLPACTVYSEAGAISAPPDARVEVEFSRFEITDRGFVELRAAVAVSFTAAPDAVRVERYALRGDPSGHSTADLVANMSLVLGTLSDSIAEAVVRGPSPAPSSTAGATSRAPPPASPSRGP